MLNEDIHLENLYKYTLQLCFLSQSVCFIYAAVAFRLSFFQTLLTNEAADIKRKYVGDQLIPTHI